MTTFAGSSKRSNESRRRRLRWLAGGVLGAFTLVAATPAVAEDGQWWYDVYAVADAHAAGWTGDGVKIAVIDAQINSALPDFEGADLTVAPGVACEGSVADTTEPTPDAQHGSTVTAMLIGNGTGVAGTRGIVPDASVTFYGLGTLEGCEPTAEVQAGDFEPIGWALRRALDDGADIIMTSIVVGEVQRPDVDVVAEALARKVPIVAGGPNDVFNEGLYPAGLNGVVHVGAVDSSGQLSIGGLGVPNVTPNTSVVAPGVGIATIGDESTPSWDVAGLGSGTSLATPLVAGIVAAAMQKYPEATGDQILQSLAHNTGSEPHELHFEETGGFGFGVASLRRVLAADPLQYEDTNPMLYKRVDPYLEDIEAAAAALASPQPTDEPQAGLAGSIVPVIVGVGAVVLILIIAAVIVTVVLVRRSNRNHARGQS